MKPQRLNIESEALEEFRQKLNSALEIMTCQLIWRKLKKGTVTAKVSITIGELTDPNGEIYYEMELEPTVNIKVGASEKLECGRKSTLMKQDNQGRPMIASAQIGMDELVDEGGMTNVCTTD